MHNKLNIKTKKFDAEYSVIITELFNSRTDCDYDDFFEPSEEDVRNQIASAEKFLVAVENFLNS